MCIPPCIDFYHDIHDKKQRRRFLIGILFSLPVVIIASILQRFLNQRFMEIFIVIFLALLVIVVCVAIVWMLITDNKRVIDMLNRIYTSMKNKLLEPGRFCVDWIWFRGLPNVESLSRSDLVMNLEKHTTPRWRREYVDSLIQNKVQLTDDWPSGKRPQFDDDELVYKLMKLDCADLSDLRKVF